MRFEQLLYFETLLQEGSFNKAAARLHITQPALTANIKSMEKELGTTLLTRDTRGFALTEDGKTVLEFSQNINKQYHQLMQTLQKNDTVCHGEVSILASTFFTEIILEQFLYALNARYKQIRVRLIENELMTSPQNLFSIGSNLAVVSRLTSTDDDKCAPGMLLSDEQFYNDKFIYQPLFQDTFGTSMSKHNKLSSLRDFYPITLNERAQPVTTFRLTSFLTDSVNRLVLSSNNIRLHIHAMHETEAVCSLPYFVHKQYFANEESIIWRPYSNNVSITYYLVYPIEHTLTAAEQIFIDELQKYLTQIKFK